MWHSRSWLWLWLWLSAPNAVLLTSTLPGTHHKQAALPSITNRIARDEKKGPPEIHLSASPQNFRTKRRPI